MFVYQQSEPGLYTVGFYKPNGKWEAESDHESREAAAERVHWLNGTGEGETMESRAAMNQQLEKDRW